MNAFIDRSFTVRARPGSPLFAVLADGDDTAILVGRVTEVDDAGRVDRWLPRGAYGDRRIADDKPSEVLVARTFDIVTEKFRGLGSRYDDIETLLDELSSCRRFTSPLRVNPGRIIS